jgi:4-hydroxy-4-methyl-2-oxoglutarate aldolase
VPDSGVDLVNAEQLYTAVIGDILDQLGFVRQFLPARVQPIEAGMKVVGRAFPVRLAAASKVRGEGFANLVAALDALRPGEVYLASGGAVECAAWGELMTATARGRGAVGAVVDAYHRDTDRILEQRWPVFSHGAWAQDASVRSVVLDFGERIDAGGVEVARGDLVVGDRDGVLVVPASVEAEVLGLAVEKARIEAQMREAIDGGTSATEAFRRFGVL